MKKYRNKREKKMKIYCAICSGKHSEQECPNKIFTKQQQLSNVRERFANAVNVRHSGDY